MEKNVSIKAEVLDIIMALGVE